MYIARKFILLLFCLSACSLYAQHVTVDDITVEGNKHTKLRYILSVLDIKKGSTIAIQSLGERLENNRKRLLGTALFTSASLNIKDWNTNTNIVGIHITLTEGLYIYPTVILEHADRNINVWLKEFNLDFSRVNYGLGLSHINLFGFHDHLRIKAQRGYNNKYEIKYHRPLAIKNIGLSGELFYADYHEVPYATKNNKLKFTKSKELNRLWQRRRASLGMDYRQSPYISHECKLTLYSDNIDESVRQLNKDFYYNGSLLQRFVTLEYSIVRDKRSFSFYPNKGNFIKVKLLHEGLGIFRDYSNTSVELAYEYYIPWTSRLTSAHRIGGKVRFQKHSIPYYNLRALGYKDEVIRGYELYVVNGADYITQKSSLRYHAYSNEIQWGRTMFVKPLRKMSVEMHLRFSIENGYVYDPYFDRHSPLSNTLLTGGGIGLDIILYHTVGLAVEYNINHRGEAGFFFKLNTNF